jgi:TrmH family RNA methyltransferase
MKGFRYSRTDLLENVRAVMVGTRNPLNLGAAARAMSNFGVEHLRVVRPYEVAFREARSAVGAAKLLARAEEFATVAEAVADCELVVGTTAGGRRELQHELRPLPVGARAIRKRLESGPVAVLFGSEKVGLSNHDMSHCHWLIRIPTREAHGSMNLGQAVAVCLYELAREDDAPSGKRKDTGGPKMPAKSGDQERLTRLLFEALCASGYVETRGAAATEEKLRRLVRRMDLERTDTELWFGILRQISWKLGKGK